MENINTLIEQHKIAIDTPVIENANSDVFLIRHGFSQFNWLHKLMDNPADHQCEQWFALKRDPTLCDPDLHAIGVRQCEANASKLEVMNFTRVFVSPMQRALQTAIHMFKTHPNKENIVFIVLPLIHEYFNTSNDIPADCYKVMERYAVGNAECHGLKFDFSMLMAQAVPQMWCIDSLTNVEKRSKLMSKMPAQATWE